MPKDALTFIFYMVPMPLTTERASMPCQTTRGSFNHGVHLQVFVLSSVPTRRTEGHEILKWAMTFGKPWLYAHVKGHSLLIGSLDGREVCQVLLKDACCHVDKSKKLPFLRLWPLLVFTDWGTTMNQGLYGLV